MTTPVRAKRPVLAGVLTGLAGLLVLFALVAPNQLGDFTPDVLLRIPIEALFAVLLLLLLPARGRRVVALVGGVVLGLLTVLKVIDLGFSASLDRPFDLVLDWALLDDAVGFLSDSVGGAGAIGAVIGAVLLIGGVVTLVTLAVRRLSRLVVRHDAVATRAVAVLGVLWFGAAAFGAPVADASTSTLVADRTRQIDQNLNDPERFAAELAADRFRDTPGDQLLTALSGKDVVLTFVESYGRSAIEDPAFARQVGAVLDDGYRQLRAAGYSAQSGFLTSPVAGGGSWLAHATLLSGTWVHNDRRHHTLLASDRMTLNNAFRRASWQTVGVMPAVGTDWPEGAFFGYDRFYDARNLGYQGPRFSYAPMPDQYTLSAFQRLERSKTDRGPVMAEIPLVSSHAPWAAIPRFIDWDSIGDGSIFHDVVSGSTDPHGTILRDAKRARTEYRRSIEYTLQTLISYVQTYGNDELVFIFLGDHQAAPVVTGPKASRDVPITIVTRDRKVLERIADWGWHDGLKPGPKAPVWRMDAFRDRFLTAFR